MIVSRYMYLLGLIGSIVLIVHFSKIFKVGGPKMIEYPPAASHGEIIQIFDDIFFVTGANTINFDGLDQQDSRNMIIVREAGKLSLINTVRLTEEGLVALEKLGKVDKVIRIGAFHGRDDAFYVNKYKAAFWALPGIQDERGLKVDVEFTPHGKQPFGHCSLFTFQATKFPEAIIHIKQHGGILISCDSIKNWVAPDGYFSEKTAQAHKQDGFFGKATISKIWRDAMGVKVTDFEKLKKLSFKHVLSAHGEPLLQTAYEDLMNSIKKIYGV